MRRHGMQKISRQVWVAIALCANIQAGVVLEEYRISPERSPARVRPQETLALQVKAYGRVEQEGEETQRGRIEYTSWKASVKEENGGGLSKPFKFQGQDNEPIVREKKKGFLAALSAGAGQFMAKDSTLYTAPKQPGKYTIEVTSTFQGTIVSATLEVEVAEDAPASWAEPVKTFGAEAPDESRYRKLAERYAPFVAQETWFDPRADYLHRFDYDGDLVGDNNWDNLEKGSSQAYVYYAAMETDTHWFLHYNFFHPRDYSDNCIVGTCHENDNEGIVLTVRKDGSEFGKLDLMETLAHNNVYTYTNRRDLKKSLHNVDGELALVDETHPVVFLEAGGHGALGGADRKSFFDARKLSWKQNTGVTFEYKGVAETNKGGLGERIGYELLPIYEHWWKPHQRSDAQGGSMFADFTEYRPFGNRPRPENPSLASAFLGKKHAANKARPFWGWFDEAGKRKKVFAPGQWALDPAYSVRQSLKFPTNEKWSYDYTFNPYLGVNTGDDK